MLVELNILGQFGLNPCCYELIKMLMKAYYNKKIDCIVCLDIETTDVNRCFLTINLFYTYVERHSDDYTN